MNLLCHKFRNLAVELLNNGILQLKCLLPLRRENLFSLLMVTSFLNNANENQQQLGIAVNTKN